VKRSNGWVEMRKEKGDSPIEGRADADVGKADCAWSWAWAWGTSGRLKGLVEGASEGEVVFLRESNVIFTASLTASETSAAVYRTSEGSSSEAAGATEELGGG